MLEELKELKIEDIQSEEQKAIAKVIGLDAYIKLVDFLGGTSVYILKKDNLLKYIRNRKIKEEFDGSNYTFLAKKYNLTDRRIRDIVDEDVLDGQIKFDLN